MNIQSGQDHSVKLSELNKKILEVKKKIQLSEGQRKALFEECEAERKSNADEILKLKKEISKSVVVLHESRSSTAKYLIQNKRLEEVIGPLDNKSINQVQEALDLQIIDKCKQLNLLKYQIKKKRNYLSKLGGEYKTILSKKERRQLNCQVKNPLKKASSELQNSIHAVEIQLREADHIKNRYLDIQKSLKSDADKFESNIQKLEEELESQNSDIAKLEKIMDEATKMRSIARSILLQEEKAATSCAHKREKEATEGRRLISVRKLELERLERRLFQGGRIPVRPEPEGGEEGVLLDEEKPETPLHPFESLTNQFNILKQATGATQTEEVLERFKTQKDTSDRLNFLRKQSEKEKKALEKTLEQLKSTLDAYKYAEVKEAERRTNVMEAINKEIEENKKSLELYASAKGNKLQAIESLAESLGKLFTSLNPLAVPHKDPIHILENIQRDLEDIIAKIEKENIGIEKVEMENALDVQDEKWLPSPYSSLVRRTPVPQTGTSPAPPPPPGSDDEEEVPSRGYLKRQAQLVVDAKSRRKNLRIQIPKRT